MACAIPTLSMLRNPMTILKAEVAARMQTRSINQAVKRVTGPARSWEKRMPSGVLISNVLVLATGRRF